MDDEDNLQSVPFLEVTDPKHTAWYPKENFFVNLAGLYNYLEMPYYISQDFENSGREIHPTCKEMLDAYIAPLFLEKARSNGLEIPQYYISNGYFEPPVIIDPINPFSIKSCTVYKNSRVNSIAKSMTRNFTYAVCCQEIPAHSKVTSFHSILGWTLSRNFLAVSNSLWQCFRIPLAKVRVIVTALGQVLMSDISPLPIESLGLKERHFLEQQIQWQK